jgi:hypothetical protein
MMNADLRSERAYFKEEMRRRIDLIAADYGVPASEVAREVAKVRGRLKHDDALCFAQKYRISLDWLICGAERSSRGEHEAPTPITSKA